MNTGAERLTAFATGTGGLTGITWLTYPNVLSLIGFCLSLTGMVLGFVLMRRERAAQFRRDEWMMDMLAHIRVEQAETKHAVKMVAAKVIEKKDPSSD